MAAPQRVKDLVENFTANLNTYKSNDYLEEDLRTNFLNPFFQELGWDMEDRAGKGAMRDLHYEKKIKAGAPDYGFYTDDKLRFFVEAKNPSLNICTNQDAALQLRDYGWSAKVPRCILTDFEELSIYDTTVKPRPSDQARVARVEGICIKYTELVERWDYIAATFSREAVMAGSLEKLEKMHANQAVDKELLVDISRWREMLAKNIANRNQVSEERLNRIVQDTIGRILFLRICEDRGIAHEGDLNEVADGDGVYDKLYKLFKKAERRYDSDLFEVKSIANLVVDDNVLKDIISELYFPKSPYKFDAIPAEILGQVYEQFLGKVIRLTEGGHAKVEDKPEVRRAGGIYYTPTYIVEYIVRNTVGKLVEGKTPKKIETLSIVDPACGSGSFLLGAYKFLADWYRDWYVADNATKHEKAKKIYRDMDKQWQLTLDERKRILMAHIFGVDIDRQAVELTKLSLMLEALRAPEQQSLFNDQMLPRLGNNIKCGNSLIGTDYFSNRPEPEPGERSLINPFDWEGRGGFPEIMARGGFDAVIGNPPYGFHEIHSEDLKTYFKTHIVSSHGSFEHYFLFYEASLKKLRKNGYHGFIVPVTWLTIPSANNLRKFILDNYSLESIVWLPELVFKNAQVNTLISIIRYSEPDSTKILISDLNDPAAGKGLIREIKQTKFIDDNHLIHIFESTAETEILSKIESNSIALESVARPCSGYNPYEIGKGKTPKGQAHSQETVTSRPYHSNTKQGKKWKPEIIGREIERFGLKWSGHRFVKYGPWLAAARDPSNFTGPRLLIQEITGGNDRRIIAAFTDKELYHSRDVIPVKCDSAWPSPLFLIGIVNSWLVTWRHHRRSPKAKKALFPKVLVNDLKQIPVPKLTKNDSRDIVLHNNLEKLVKRMMEFKTDLALTKAESEQLTLQRQIDATDQQIDQLVYKLYGLTDEEIHIVEGSKE